MARLTFDHERLDGNRLSIDGVAFSTETSDPMRAKLKRIVAMLTRLAMRSDRVSESPTCYDSPPIDYEHEHRCAEHETWSPQLAGWGQTKTVVGDGIEYEYEYRDAEYEYEAQ